MRVFTAAIAGLVLNLLCSALPVPGSLESNSLDIYDELFARAWTSGGGPNQGGPVAEKSKNVIVLGKWYYTMRYPNAPDTAQRAGVSDIMSEFPGLHGPWIALPGKPEVQKPVPPHVGTMPYRVSVNTRISNRAHSQTSLVDHILEVQMLHGFFNFVVKKSGWSAEIVEGVLTANHDPEFFHQKNKGKRDSEPPDYSKDKYYGSLLQHILLEFGNSERLDRLAVLSSATNNRKGVVWGGGTTKIELGQEALLDLMRVDQYMGKERDAFCDTVNAVHEVLKKFRAGRKSANPPSTGNSGITSGPSASGSKSTLTLNQKQTPGGAAAGPARPPAVPPSTPPKTAPVRQSGRTKKPVAKEGQSDPESVNALLGTPSPPKKEMPLRQQARGNKQWRGPQLWGRMSPQQRKETCCVLLWPLLLPNWQMSSGMTTGLNS